MPDADALSDFLAGHGPIPSDASLAPGTTIFCWRIVAFLGRGGTAEGTIIHLRERTFSFKWPIELAPGEYRVIGPGRLDAALSGPSNAVVRLKDCILNNTTTIRHPKNRISYVMEGGAYLNFVNLDETSQMRGAVRLGEECQGGNDYAVEFRGPLTFKKLNSKRQDERYRTLREKANR